MAPTTKSATAKFLIGQPSSVLESSWHDALKSGTLALNQHLLPFSGKARLPTKEQILLLYFAFREIKEHKLKSKPDIAEMVGHQIVKYWEMAPIKTVGFPTIKKRILMVVNEHDARRRNQSINTTTEVKKREDFLECLKKLFDIASVDAEKAIENNRFLVKKDKNGGVNTMDREDDLNFLEDQRGARVGWMTGRDEVYWQRTNKKEVRKKTELENEEERKKAAKEARKRPIMIPSDIVDDDNAGDRDFDAKVSKPTKKKKTAMVTIELPRNPWNNVETTAMMDRLKMTPAMSMGFFSSIMKTGTINNNQADLNEFVCSPSTIVRSRNKNRSVLFQIALDEFKENKPEHCNLHYDGKQLTSCLGEVNDFEAILVSGSPSFKEGKLLAVSKLSSGSGAAQFEAVKEQILLWDVRDNIRSFTFDTTSSNTGAHKGSCVRIEEWLARPLMWYGCRHHVGELLAKAAWYTLFEMDLKPTVGFFDHIKASWEEIDKSKSIQTLKGDLYNKEVALNFYKEVLQKKTKQGKWTLRDDYKELVETSMAVLGEVPPSFSWKKPGAAHKARFCSFGIYINKAVAFADQLQLDADILEPLIRVATFITTLYVPYFISSSTGCDAPVNDLDMYKKLKFFSNTDSELAESVLTVLCRHTWYLQEETVPFAFFSKKLTEDEKSRLAARLLTFEKDKPVHWDKEAVSGQESYQLGKPILELDLSPETNLVDLLGRNSFLLWDILGLDWQWLSFSPAEWDQFPSYQKMMEYVCTVKVTNDCAERGVKVKILNYILGFILIYFSI